MDESETRLPELAEGFEIVHFVLGYYDGILIGIADHRGHPHYFEIDQTTEVDRFRLTPLSAEAFAAAIEGWEIWCRWEEANRGRYTRDVQPHPALPQDRRRRDETQALLSAWLASAAEESFFREAEFEPLLPGAAMGIVRGAMQVRWIGEDRNTSV